MKIEGSVALVTGTTHAMGAAIVRALLARGAAKVYADTRSASSAKLPGALPVMLDLTRPARMSALAHELGDVTLLVNSVVHFDRGPSLFLGAGDEVPDPQQTPAARSLQLIDAFAPVLAANGGGAVVNVLSVLSPDAAWHPGDSHGGFPQIDSLLSDGLRGRLVAQRTALLLYRATLVDAGSDEPLRGQWTLADHIAMRVLDALEAIDRRASDQPEPDGSS